jgi:hypothetical protein
MYLLISKKPRKLKRNKSARRRAAMKAKNTRRRGRVYGR